MTWSWTGWAPRASDKPPYRDWWTLIGREGFDCDPGDPCALSFWDPGCPAPGGEPLDHPAQVMATVGAEACAFPLPPAAQNANFCAQTSWLPPEDKLPTVDEDTVLVGVIDTGIALGHDRFCLRRADGKIRSRVLAAWQMTHAHSQDYMPFGRELYRRDINKALKDHRDDDGHLDQGAFDTALGLVDLDNPLGSRELMGPFAHGTHVADQAAGFALDDVRGKKVAILAVVLPPPAVFGAAGTFLDDFMLMAILRLKHLAHAIRAKSAGASPGADRLDNDGHALAINLSFGRQAGAKDGLDHFTRQLALIQDQFPVTGSRAPFRVIMPSGNDNQMRANALMDVTTGQPTALPWFIPPGDYSSNYAEAWVTLPRNLLTAPPVILTLDGPSGAVPSLTGTPKPGEAATLTHHGKPVARLYCEAEGPDSATDPDFRLRLVLCLAPSLQNDPDRGLAPSGRWVITLDNRDAHPFQAALSVQTDQAVLPYSLRGLRSYFDDPDYVRFDEVGRPLDIPNEVPGSKVTRYGTVNASAVSPHVVCIGGYRVSDGKPASYSASGAKGGHGVQQLTAATPSDDAATLFGTLAAGAQNGSVVPARGTSFACAQATRQVALGWKDAAGTLPWPTATAILTAQAAAYTPPPGAAPAPVEKVGAGRIHREGAPAQPRLGPPV